MKAGVKDPCSRCGGYGVFPQFMHVHEGVCFKCNGLGSVGPEETNMCGTLKHENTNKLRGEPVPCYNPELQKYGKALWDGFAHQDRKNWWVEKGRAVPVNVLVDGFIEGSVTFKLPQGAVMQGLGLRQDVVVSGRVAGRAKQVKVLTRAPLNSFEAGIHKRWPVVVKDGHIHQFTTADVSKGQVQQSLL